MTAITGCCAHAAALSERLLASWGTRFAGPISIFRNWTFCLFYVMAELWGSVVVSLLFWGFANQVGATNSPPCANTSPNLQAAVACRGASRALQAGTTLIAWICLGDVGHEMLSCPAGKCLWACGNGQLAHLCDENYVRQCT